MTGEEVECNHKFKYPFIDCKRCGGLLRVGDYTVATITGDWSIQPVDGTTSLE